MYDSSLPKVKESSFVNAKWEEIYGEIEEDLPENMPKPRGRSVTISVFVDASHAGDHVTRRSRTGILIFLQNAPIVWYTKKQATVEASTFGSEFVALRVATEMNDALRHKLRMMGIPITGSTNTYCDNKSVVANSSKVESVLKKKHLSICYHRVRESCARKALRIAFEPTKSNLADVCTKVQSTYKKRNKLRCIIY